MRKVENICYCDIGHPRHYLDLYLPDSDTFDVFVYFHGGGLENGSKDNALADSGQYLLERNIAVVAVNYRMYPSAVFPEFIRDAAAAVAWTFKNINNYGTAKGIYVGGSSAGGGFERLKVFDAVSISCHSIEEVREAVAAGAAQIVLGNIFETDCKKGKPGRGLGFLREAAEAASPVPVHGIGGITPENLDAVLQTGAAGGCMMSWWYR